MANLNEQQLDAAGPCGFDMLRGGGARILTGLDRMLAKAQMRPKELSVMAAYGAAYRHANRDSDLYAPLRPILRAHILDNMPVAAGTVLLGTPVEVRRNHSIISLSRQEGGSHRRFQRCFCIKVFSPHPKPADHIKARFSTPKSGKPSRIN
ncbi:hypothetical protein [Paenirhodobacter sp.]|uniref:hypothetical protein n=1 Tax=Paenirhodobacter sp. TaxID=1965326 RepID=UPI003B3C69B9